MVITELKDLETLISAAIQENSSLEYKGAKSIEDKKEISKDVSSMANASGGVIIYGISEFKEKDKEHLPERIEPIIGVSREYLDQVINTSVKPKLSFKINPIEHPDGGFVFVVVIQQSDTAHQASDNRYYKRSNFLRSPMEDYEVRDVMNRSQHPKVTLKFSVVGDNLNSYLFNEGTVLAKYIRCVYEIPKHFLADPGQGEIVNYYGSDNVKNFPEFFKYDLTNKAVVHSGLKTLLLSHPIPAGIRDSLNRKSNEPDHIFFYWNVYADSARVISGVTARKDIEPDPKSNWFR
jgi:hypothetical protein